MRIRPLPGLTIASIPALALLLGLGVWQVQRAQWKADLIAQYEAAEAAPPAPLSQALCAAGGTQPGGVSVDLILGPDPLRIYGAGPQGEPGWMIVQAAYAPDCVLGEVAPERRVLVQTGFETLDGAQSAAPQTLQLEAWPEIGAFTPQNAPGTGDYFRFEAETLAPALGVAPEALVPLWARWEERPVLERVSIAPATHIGYAITWFGLAASLVAIYLALHARLGRLSFRRGG
jgi:surfeit locus 1 family protein